MTHAMLKTLRGAAALVLLVLCLSALPVLAAPPAQTPSETPAPVGVVTGQVQNRTSDQPVPDAPVQLRQWSLEVEQPPLTATTDAQGRFRFDGLDTSTHAFYRAEVEYQSVAFRSDFIAFQVGITHTVADLDVFETTDQPGGIRVQRFHFIIMAREQGILSMLELYQFSNQADRAYVGTLNSDGQRETVRMALPRGAQDLVLQSGTLGVDFLSKPGELTATAPILPGDETFDVAFVYVVPYSTPSLALDRQMYYDTDAVNGMLLDAGVDMQSETLTFAGERMAQGQNFLQFTGQDIKAGQTLPILLNRLGNIQFTNAPDSASEVEASDLSRVEHGTLLPLMLGLGGAIVVLGFAYPALHRRPAAQVAPVAEDKVATQQRLLLILARLDDAYQAGQINATAYQRARAHRKAELAELWRHTREQA